MSNYLDNFRKRMFKDGNTIQEQILNEGIESFKEYIFNAPNYFKVKMNSNNESKITNLSKEYDSTIQDVAFNDKKNLDEKLICVFNETPIEIGKYVLWHNDYWIAIFQDEKTIKTHQSFIIRPCNNTFKWIDKEGYVQELPCIIENQTLYSDGMKEGQDLTLLDTKKSVVIPYNNVSKDLEEQQRLLFNGDKRYCYEISQIDELSTKGILNLTLTQSEYNASTDDLKNNLCNINKKVKYRIEMLSIDTNVITCKQGESIQLNLQLLMQKDDKEVLVTDSNVLNKITYFSSNSSIANVDSKGLITCNNTGDCDVNIVFDDGVDKVEEKVQLHIINQIVNNSRCKILGKDKVVVGGKALYSIEFYNNEGIKVTNSCNFIITGESNEVTSLATITSVNNQECSIQITSNVKNIGKYFILKAESIDKSISDSIKVKITSVFG